MTENFSPAPGPQRGPISQFFSSLHEVSTSTVGDIFDALGGVFSAIGAFFN